MFWKIFTQQNNYKGYHTTFETNPKFKIPASTNKYKF